MINTIRMGMRKVFTACSLSSAAISKAIYRTPQEKEVERWFLDDGDNTMRVDYDLKRGSLVFDLGGYEGDWAAEITARYECDVFVFEPVPDYADRIMRRFQRNPRVKIFPFGLGKEDFTQSIHVAEEGSSLFTSPHVSKGNSDIPVHIKCASEFLKIEKISSIDLIKINIEGGEYDLLDHLIETGVVNQIGNIQVQFHDFAPNAESRMSDIQRKLALTHKLTYQYRFVWENWERKGAI